MTLHEVDVSMWALISMSREKQSTRVILESTLTIRLEDEHRIKAILVTKVKASID